MAPPQLKHGDQLAKAYHNDPVSMREHSEKVMLKLTAPQSGSGDKVALDIVVVLDISGSMQGKKLENMKLAMTNFLTKKLGSENGDSLGIITFASKVDQKFPLSVMVPDEVEKAKRFVEGLKADGYTNIKAGLEAGLEMLEKRRGRTRNVSCIFLMSDGHENVDKARTILDSVAKHSVVTFGFGENSDEQLLYDIAYESYGGTYHHVREKEDANKLMDAVSFLAIYRTISMLNLKVTVSAHKEAGAIVRGVDPCRYKVDGPHGDGSFTIHFGDFAQHENRRILVDVQLPHVQQEQKDKPVIHVKYEYSPPNMANVTKTLDIKMNRVLNPGQAAMDPNVSRELARRGQVEHLKKVMDFANKQNLGAAIAEVHKAKNALNSISEDEDKVVDAFVDELNNIHEFLDTYDIYNKLGRAYLLACISSHERQRYTERGGALRVDIYLTERMKKYLDQARQVHKNPNIRI